MKPGQQEEVPRNKPGPHESGGRGLDPKKLRGIMIAEAQTKRTGAWQRSAATKSYLGAGSLHDGNARDGQSTAVFAAELPKAARDKSASPGPQTPAAPRI